MTKLEMELKLGRLQKIYQTVRVNLENRNDWQAWNGKNWTLQYVGITSTGDLFATVNWISHGEQRIGISWENVFEQADLKEL